MYKIKSIGEYFFSLLYFYLNKIKIFFYKTNFYNKKISKNIPTKYIFKPSPHIINCLISFNKKKIKIEDLSLNSIWKIDSNNKNEFEILHSFLWLNTLDIKTSKTNAVLKKHKVKSIGKSHDLNNISKEYKNNELVK